MACNVSEACPTPSAGMATDTFSAAINYIIAAQCLIKADWPPNANVANGSTHHFIIVGSGAGGSVLANRLSEIPEWNILLLERGKHPPAESIVPGMDVGMYKTDHDYEYYTVNNGRTSQAQVKKSCYWPRAKMLGGCSQINGMIYSRGSRADYDNWVAAGNPGWSADTAECYFRKLENLQDQKLNNISDIYDFYGHKGPLIINSFNDTDEIITENILRAWDNMGIKTVSDLNYANSLGSGKPRATAFDGRRGGTAQTYLIPIQNRKNLRILTEAFVTKILINDLSEAYGVEVNIKGKTQIYFASHEVIVSAGTVNSPQLLMLSGIGCKDHLESKNIPCLANLCGVGKNVQDPINVPIFVSTNVTRTRTVEKDDFDGLSYLHNRKGYLAHGTLSNSIVFFSRDAKASYPEFEIHLKIFWQNSKGLVQLLKNNVGYEDSLANPILEENKNRSIFVFFLSLLHPFSRGTITLNSNDPFDYPLIDPNHLIDERDLQATVDGIRRVTKIVNDKYFKSIDAFLGRIKWAPCDKFDLDSESYWKCIVTNILFTVYHPVGTCKMGPDPTDSVVDNHLRVYLTKKLRVVDGSVMSNITSGNTNGPVVMLAERAADFIKLDHKVITKGSCDP